MKRLEVYYTDITDIQSLIKQHFNFEYDYIFNKTREEIMLFDCTKIIPNDPDVASCLQTLLNKDSGVLRLGVVLRALVSEEILKPAHYFIESPVSM